MGRLSLTFLISFLLIGFVHADEDHDEAFKLLRSGEVLSLAEILEINQKDLKGRILEVELEHEDNRLIYELEILNEKCVVWEFKVDARDGTIIKQEQD